MTKNKVVLVTGVFSGIGREIAQPLAEAERVSSGTVRLDESIRR